LSDPDAGYALLDTSRASPGCEIVSLCFHQSACVPAHGDPGQMGASYPRIKAETGIPERTVRYWRSRFEGTAELQDKARTGRPSVLVPAVQARLLKVLHAKPGASPRKVQSSRVPQLLSRTIRRFLKAQGFNPYKIKDLEAAEDQGRQPRKARGLCANVATHDRRGLGQRPLL